MEKKTEKEGVDPQFFLVNPNWERDANIMARIVPLFKEQFSKRFKEYSKQYNIKVPDLDNPDEVREFVKTAYEKQITDGSLKKKIEQAQQNLYKSIPTFLENLKKAFNSYQPEDPTVYVSPSISPMVPMILKGTEGSEHNFTEFDINGAQGKPVGQLGHEVIHLWWFNYMKEKRPSDYNKLGSLGFGDSSLEILKELTSI